MVSGEDDYGSYGDSEEQDEWGESSDEEATSPQPKSKRIRKNESYEKAIFELIDQKHKDEMKIVIEWDNLTKIIDECPKIPQPPIIEQINPPPYQMPRVLLGMAKDEEGSDKKKTKPKKPPQKDKGPPHKPVKWADAGPMPQKESYHYIEDAREQLAENIFPLNIRGT